MGLWMLVGLAAFAAVMVACFGEAAPVTGDAAPGESGPEGAGAPEATPSPAATEPHDTLAEVDKFAAALGQHAELANWSEVGKRWYTKAQAAEGHKTKADAHDALGDGLLAAGRERYPDSSEAEHRKYIEDEGMQAYAELVYGAASKKDEDPAPPKEGEPTLTDVVERLGRLEAAATGERQRQALVQDFIAALDAADVKDPDTRTAVFKAARGLQLTMREQGEKLTTTKAVKAILEEREKITTAARAAYEAEAKTKGAEGKLPPSVPSNEPPKEDDDRLGDMDEEEREMVERMRKNMLA